jgi:alpha-tubulin suppressor-like RCC1 family protein
MTGSQRDCTALLTGPGSVAMLLLLAVGALTVFGACRDEPMAPLDPFEPEQPEEPEGPALVSDPSPVSVQQQASAGSGLASSASSSFSWISFVPETYVEASETRLRNLASGAIVSALLVDGGMDPVPVPALVGDSIEITVLSGQQLVARTVYLVPPRRPPVVVRSSPPRGRKAVPINTSIVIVFSEPIDPASVNEGSIRLVGGSDSVPVEIDVLGDGFSVELIPGQDLAVETLYEVTIGQEVVDLTGDSLETVTVIGFETAAAAPTPIVVLQPESVTLAAGTAIQLTARLSTGGRVSAESPDQWVTSDSSRAVVKNGLVSTLSEGDVTITAFFGEYQASASLTVMAASGVVLSAVTGGGRHTCGLTGAGATYCWGSNDYGQLGSGAGGSGATATHPVAVVTEVSFVEVSAGGDHTCGLASDGTVYCWGRNDHGQLGDGSTIDRTRPVPVGGNARFSFVDAGGSHTCGLTTGNEAYCWGANNASQLGVGGASRNIPVPVSGGHRFVHLSTGPQHACGVANDGNVLCWGANAGAQLGQDTAAVRMSAVPVENPHLEPAYEMTGPVANVAAGGRHSCFAAAPGRSYENGHASWWCWGVDVERAQSADDGGGGGWFCVLGSEFVPCEVFPFPLDNAGRVPASPISVMSGQGHGCAVLPVGDVYCWGSNEFGQRGDAGNSAPTRYPRKIEGLSFTALSAGAHHTCGVTRSGSTYCWGRNDRGQLGDGTMADRDQPQEVVF